MKNCLIRIAVSSLLRTTLWAALGLACFASTLAMATDWRRSGSQKEAICQGGCGGGCGPCSGTTSPTPSGPSPEEVKQQKERARLKAKAWSSDEALDYFDRKDWDNAIRSFEEALDRDPDDPDLNDWLKRAKAEKVKARVPTVASPKKPPDPNRTFIIERVDYRGEFYMVTSDGRHLSGQNAAQVAIDNGTRLFTGPSGHVVIHLPDSSTWTIGPNSEFTIDSFVYDPSPGVRKVTMNVVKGFFRWVTGTVSPRYSLTVILPVVAVGFRGTDVECVITPGGSGYVKLYSGKLELKRRDTGAVMAITAGQTVRFKNFKVVGH